MKQEHTWMVAFLLFAGTAKGVGAQEASSGLRIQLVDASSKTPLPGVRVRIASRRVETNDEGKAEVKLPPGLYDLETRYDLYEPEKVSQVEVEAGEIRDVIIELNYIEGSGEEIIVEVFLKRGTEEAQLRLRRESSAVQDGVSAEEMSRSGDGDAGGAVKRVVGATLVGGQYLFVRGLGGRYIATLLNGAPLPSTDPDQPGVQLDLFPSSVLSSLTLVKTFTPDLPGDASGGTLQLSTKDFPDQFGVGLTLSLGFNDRTSFQNAPLGQTGGLDWFGMDDGTRNTPRALPKDRPLLPSEALPQDGVDQIGQRFKNTWRIADGLVGPNGKIGFNMGDTLRVGARRVGYVFNLSYSNSSQTIRGERVSRVYLKDAEDGEVGSIPERERISTTQAVQWGGLFSLKAELSRKDQMGLVLLGTQTGEAYTGVLTGYDADLDADVRQSRVRYTERNLWLAQLLGDHKESLPFGMSAKWNITGSLGNRSEPDTKDLILTANTGTNQYRWRPSPGSGERLFLSLGQRELGGSADVSLPLSMFNIKPQIKFGGAVRVNEREFSLRRFLYLTGPNYVPTDAFLEPQELFARQNVGDKVRLFETTSASDGYRASQSVLAAYLMADVPVASWMKLIGGARVESFRQSVLPQSPFQTQTDASAGGHRTDVDVLGSVGLIFTLSEQVSVRAGYGSTVARPQVRELAPFLYPDFIRLRNILGNPALKRARLDNFDARLEWFPSVKDVLALTLFAKNFENPIEMVAFANNTFSYANASGGFNAGVEFEVKLGLQHLSKALEGFDVGTNATFLHSEVRISDADRGQSTSQSRPLAGQSPFVINASLGYENEPSGFGLRIMYNVFGRRLSEVGREGLPDIYQEPTHSMDLAVDWKVIKEVSLKLNIENILYDDTELTQGGVRIQNYNQGLTGTLGVSINL